MSAPFQVEPRPTGVDARASSLPSALTTVRRGAGGIAIIIALVFLQLLVVGAIVTETRDQDISRIRLDATRAFYAAEAGSNMALRESISGLDEDHDGVIGTISSDGNANNDPTIGTARFTVDRALVSGVTQIVSSGRAGLARRKADARVSGVIGGVTQTVMAAFGKGTNTTPRFSKWSGSAWGSSANMPDIGGQPKWVRMKICPTRNETWAVIEDLSSRVNVLFYNGTTWSSPYLVSTDTGGTNDRPEDVGYEQNSSDALCVYWRGTIGKFGYRVYNGTSFSAETTIANPFATECDFLALYPRPTSDEMVLLAADGNAGGPLVGAFWSGGSFLSWTQLCASIDTNNQECFGMAYESQTGKGVAVYTESGVATPRYRTLTGSTWSSQASLPTVGGVAKWIRLAADPTSNQILFALSGPDPGAPIRNWKPTAAQTTTVAGLTSSSNGAQERRSSCTPRTASTTSATEPGTAPPGPRKPRVPAWAHKLSLSASRAGSPTVRYSPPSPTPSNASTCFAGMAPPGAATPSSKARSAAGPITPRSPSPSPLSPRTPRSQVGLR